MPPKKTAASAGLSGDTVRLRSRLVWRDFFAWAQRRFGARGNGRAFGLRIGSHQKRYQRENDNSRDHLLGISTLPQRAEEASCSEEVVAIANCMHRETSCSKSRVSTDGRQGEKRRLFPSAASLRSQWVALEP